MLLRLLLSFCLCGQVLSVQAATTEHSTSVPNSAASLSSTLQLRHAWVRAMPPGSQMTAAYFMLTNEGTEVQTLVGANSDIATSAGLHRSTQQQGHASMKALKQVVIEPGASTTFRPGGLHVMLEGLKFSPRVGDRVPVCLVFVKGRICETFLVLRHAPSATSSTVMPSMAMPAMSAHQHTPTN